MHKLSYHYFFKIGELMRKWHGIVVVIYTLAQITLYSMEINNNNEQLSEYAQLMKKVRQLILPLQQCIKAQAGGLVIEREKNIWILPSTTKEFCYDYLFATNQQDLLAMNLLQKQIQPHMGDSAWKQQVLSVFKGSNVGENLRIKLAEKAISTYWKYDGPNQNNNVIIARTDIYTEFSTFLNQKMEYVSQYKYFLYNVTDAWLKKEEALQQSCYMGKNAIVAIGLAYKKNRCALVTDKKEGGYISILDVGATVIENNFKVSEEGIKRLQFLTAMYLYALTDKKEVYALDLKDSTPSFKKQTFKDKEGQELEVRDFAIDQKNPNQGVLLSNHNVLYLVNIPRKRFMVLHVLGNYGNPNHIKMFDNRIGLFRDDDTINVKVIDLSINPA